MSEQMELYGLEQAKEAKPKRGRPKGDTVILYRDGGRIRAWNTRLAAKVNTPGKLPQSVRVYDGLGCDWVAWSSPVTRDGDYNVAGRSPFRKAAEEGRSLIPALEEFFKENPGERALFERLELLFAGRPQPDGRPIFFSGTYWIRFFASLFIRDAGVDGINRSNRQPITGKVWASVNVLPSQGSGYNYTEEAWYSVVNAVRPPLFCVRVNGSEYATRADVDGDFKEQWPPERLAAAVLASLEASAGLNSCSEPAEKDAEPSPAPETEPERPAVAPEAIQTCEETGEAEPPKKEAPEAVSDAPAAPAAEARQSTVKRTWGEYLNMEVAVKGLTTSKDLGMSLPLSKVIQMVTDHAVTRSLTEECRKRAEIYKTTGDKKPLNEFKRDNLHVWYAAPVFAERFKGSVKANIKGYTGLACLDFDGFKSTEEAEEVRDDLFIEFPEVLFSAVSASGLGAYAIVALDFDGTEEGYRTALDAAFQMFEAKGYMPDTGCSDPTRARYISADAMPMSRPADYEVKPISAEGEGYRVLSVNMLRDCWTNSGRKRKGAGKEYLKEAIARIGSAPDGSKDTVMTSVMGTAARLIRNYGLDSEWVYGAIRKAGREYGYDERKTEDKIKRLGVKNGGGF